MLLCSLWSRSNLRASRRKFSPLWPPNKSHTNVVLSLPHFGRAGLKPVALKWCVFWRLTCTSARKLASPFGQPGQVSKQV